MEFIKAVTIDGNIVSIVDVSGRSGGKWRITRVIRVVETHGAYHGLNRRNVIREHFSGSYGARSRKQRLARIVEALAVFDQITKQQNSTVIQF